MKKLLVLALAVLAAAVATVAGAAQGPTSAWDKEWLKTSLAGDRFEIQGGKLALSRSHNAALRTLARHLVSDHSKSLHEGARLAASLGVKVPKSPEPSMVWELKMVSSLPTGAFERWYSSLEVYDHVQDVQEAQSEVSEGTNPDVRHEAAKDLPTLKMHLRLSRRALAQT